MFRPRLPKDLSEKIDALCAKGRKAWLQGRLEEAEQCVLTAWNELPEPKMEHDYYPEVLSRGIVTFYQETKQFPKAIKWLDTLEKAYDPDGSKNASVLFKRATVYFDAGRLDEAFSIFDGLYKTFKARPFQGSDKRYLDFYKKRINSIK